MLQSAIQQNNIKKCPAVCSIKAESESNSKRYIVANYSFFSQLHKTLSVCILLIILTDWRIAKNIVIFAGSLGFDSRTGQSDPVSPTAHSPPLRRFFFGVVLPGRCSAAMEPNTR